MTDTYIPRDDLVVGAVYELRSRNLVAGVWTGRGFIGIREKFGEEYLFTEYHYDDGPLFGTVRPVADLNVSLDGLSLTEYWGLKCFHCGKAGWKIREGWTYPEGNRCAGGCSDEDRDLRMVTNQMLFDALKVIEAPICQRLEDEFNS
ncbi:hypothetical protein SEA_TYKE_54 [Mycobacterium phage Tyke]|uniref:Uncharacterized protein n=5 Tax=Bixzunavirus TaxID=680114 RepID=A0A1B1PBR7_9CAUD|nr:hypothetical protein KHO64_gp052 [Mycobacterium phage Quasimodo]AEJ94913.1 hypothetical protein GHOST_52 [Mycobacterium phage Ghost]AKG94618.1 hypothetical protein SEA_MOMO_51 [Mycobacterium phage Momo]ALF50916.1 hypothetical protein SEA_DTDEVON_53 [Mycobacterium phage DTDevon]ANT41589.1 hypothetical protein PBI_LITTLETON_52 [Mycobacterium phage Littleton]ATN87276.1 hypothetical protein SEA_AUDRICK_54 [Mycobacterium phage Audrick]AVI04655.1 hypothetical protein SEA_LIFESAVOR_52 [Mycobacter